ncbi:MAG: Ig-like domain-containing protein [Nitrospirae bacterium]|nr:Ig-like domain-containing protein [Nitrospirota bacterium]
MKRTAVRWFGIIAMLIAATACSKNPDVNVTTAPAGTGGGGGSAVATIQVTPAGPFTRATGQTQQLSATALDASGNPITSVTFIWSSSNSSVATVSSTGLVTAVAPGGPVNITASSGTITSNAVSVTVSCAGIPSNTPTPISVVFNPAGSINVNGTSTVTATVRDCNGNPVPDNTTVTFSVSPSSLGTLSPSSAPTTGGGGVATISFIAGANSGAVTVTAIAGTVSNSANLTINALPSGSIKFEQANPQVIGVKGSGQVEVSEVSFSVKDTQGNPVSDGSVTVHFQFLDGFNPGGGATIAPPAVATLGGIAKTFVKSGYVAGPVRILAYVDMDGSVTFTTGDIYSTSTPLSIGGGVPSARFFSVSADIHNLAGLAYDNEVAKINVLLADRFGDYNILTGTSVSFYTEAGAIDRQGVTDDKGQTSVVLRTQNRMPIDTDPRQDLNPIGNEVLLYNNLNANGHDAGELFEDYNGNVSYDVGEHFFDQNSNPLLNGNGYNFGEPNPRDGWVTVLAVTMGEETFYDQNGNGVYDSGEPFDDNGGEPFIDENDNGMYDDKETFVDMNANNSYDPGEPFYDKGRGEPFNDLNDNGVRDLNEPFTDMNGNFAYDGPGDAFLVDPFLVAPGGTAPCRDKTTGAPKTVGCTRGGFYDYVYNTGEFFVDTDGDGKWTHGNGVWDRNTAIWVDLRSTNQKVKKSQTMVFTGPPDVSLETSKIVIDEFHRDPRPGAGSNYWIHNGECADMEIHVADINNNALIPGTTIDLKVDQGEIIGSSSLVIPDNSGGGPYVFGVAVCDENASKIEMKASSLNVDIAWQPQNATAKLNRTMAIVGTKDAPFLTVVTIISPTPLQNGVVLCPTPKCYNVTLSASGGGPPYTWSLTLGTLPPNFNMDSTGLITQNGDSGTGAYNFTVQAIDVLGTTATKALSITIP